MINNNITLQQIIDTVRQLAADSPDNMYVSESTNGCSYSLGTCRDGTTGCIFGQAFRDLDIDIPSNCDCERIGNVLVEVLRIEETNENLRERRWCTEVQKRQDRGVRWKDCVSDADNIHESY